MNYKTHQSGHVPDTFNNHGSIQDGWNLWLHGKTRISSPRTKSSVQIEQPSPSSDPFFLCPPAPSALISGPMTALLVPAPPLICLSCSIPSVSAPAAPSEWWV